MAIIYKIQAFPLWWFFTSLDQNEYLKDIKKLNYSFSSKMLYEYREILNEWFKQWIQKINRFKFIAYNYGMVYVNFK